MNRLLVGAGVITAALLAVSCAPAEPEVRAVSDRLPEGVSVSVSQSRMDVVVHGLRLKVKNESGDDVVVTDAEFQSDQFSSTAVWEKDSTVIADGRTVALPVLLPDAVCDDGPPSARVRLTLIVGDAAPVTAEVAPVDEFDQLPALRVQDCFAQTVDSIVALRAETLPRDVTVNGRAAVQLDLTAPPAGADGTGTVSIDSLAGTTLLAVLDPATDAVQPVLPIAVRVPDPGASPVTVTFVPNRCDPHAVAEDKQGTLIPLALTVSGDSASEPGVSGQYRVAASPAVKAALLDFVATACGFKPTG